MKQEEDIPIAVPVPVPVVPVPIPTQTATSTFSPSPTAPVTPIAPPIAGIQHQKSSFYVATTHTATNKFSDHQINQLRDQGYTLGQAHELLLFSKTFSLRFWVVDNSGSMSLNDGNRLVSTKNQSKVKMVPCTRWKEIQETVDYHAQLAALLQIPTTFKLLNNPGAHAGPQEFSIGTTGPASIDRDLQIARDVMKRASPQGVTPLARHVREIREEVYELTPSLLQQGRKVAIILATDGLPTDEYGISGAQSSNDFTAALRSLEGLPVWIVIRLCTDEDKVVDFYNNIDAQLEVSIEVLDDYIGEAKEVFAVNPWLNYTLPTHRMREMGIQNKLFDLLDERKFTLSEIYDFCLMLFGTRAFEKVPDPEVDLKGFLKNLARIVDKHRNQWNPISHKPKQLIDVKLIGSMYGDGCTIM